jgi:DNA end-binding protein Ku
MAPRPSWKGYLKLSLVSCAVALYPASTTSERVSFRTLNRATGNRVRRQFVDEASGDPVETEDQVKGYEVAKGEGLIRARRSSGGMRASAAWLYGFGSNPVPVFGHP